jgi:uroporphyrinogen decarboxylase
MGRPQGRPNFETAEQQKMGMTRKNRVMRAVAHEETDRVPVFMDCTTSDVLQNLIRQVGAKDEEDMHQKLGVDCRWCNCMEDIYPYNRYSKGTYVDMWGIEKSDYGGIPTAHPLARAETIEDLERYPHWPRPGQIDFDKYVKRMERFSQYAVFGGMWGPFLEQASLLVGMEKLMVMMYEAPEFVHYLLDKTFGFYYACNQTFFDKARDRMQIFFMGDDYGTQTGLLYGPELWREFIAPRLKKIYDLAKNHGYYVQHHTCGSVVDILQDMIDLGLDGLHPIQITAAGMDVGNLKNKFGQKLYFAGAIDGMRTLINGTSGEIAREVRHTISVLGCGGGYIFGPSQGFLPEIPVGNIELMYRLAVKL